MFREGDEISEICLKEVQKLNEGCIESMRILENKTWSLINLALSLLTAAGGSAVYLSNSTELRQFLLPVIAFMVLVFAALILLVRAIAPGAVYHNGEKASVLLENLPEDISRGAWLRGVAEHYDKKFEGNKEVLQRKARNIKFALKLLVYSPVLPLVIIFLQMLHQAYPHFLRPLLVVG